MLVRVVKRWNAVEVECRQHLHAGGPGQECLMLPGYPLALCRITRKKNGDGVQRRVGEATNPLFGTIPARIAEHLRPRWHTLPEFLWERCERLIVHSKHSKSMPREGN